MKIKKFLSLAMALVMLFSVMPMAAFAEDVDYQQGTLVTYGDADNEHASEAYTITVPALLKPSQSGTVTATGTWASNRVLTVTADETVTLTNSIKAADEKVLDVTFLGITKEGSNTEAVSATETVAVADIQNALFGVWSGKFNYNVEMTDAAGSEMPDMPADDGIVPEGGTYYVGLTGESYAVGDYTGYTAKYEAGDKLPEVVNVGDTYVYNDYEYRYGYSWMNMWMANAKVEESASASISPTLPLNDGWSVRVIDNTKSSYGKMESYINGEPVVNAFATYLMCMNLTETPVLANTITSMYATFAFSGVEDLSNLVIPSGVIDLGAAFANSSLRLAPEIPNGVISMNCTFMDCASLISAPAIPNSVTNMDTAFKNCESLTTTSTIGNNVIDMTMAFMNCSNLTTVSTIPESVNIMGLTFSGCTSLTGIIEINANPEIYTNCFDVVDFQAQNLVLTGNSTVLDELAEWSDNYCADCNGYCAACNGNHDITCEHWI